MKWKPWFITALDCPDNTVYDPCFSGCPATCSSPGLSQSCDVTCQETCRCADCLVLDGGNCVDPALCGCTLDDDVQCHVLNLFWSMNLSLRIYSKVRILWYHKSIYVFFLFYSITALDCPTNTVYDPCFSGCQATCSSAGSGQSCDITCQETCRCADGLVLDGGDCIDPSQCGCTLDNGVYLPVSLIRQR